MVSEIIYILKGSPGFANDIHTICIMSPDKDNVPIAY